MDKSADSSSSASSNATGNPGGGTEETPPSTKTHNDNISLGCGAYQTTSPGSDSFSSNATEASEATTNASASLKNGTNSTAITAASNFTSASMAMGNNTAASNSSSSSSITNNAVATNGVMATQTSSNNVVAATTSSSATSTSSINLNISTTTGGNFGVAVDPQISVESLKKIVAKKLKVAKDRICLLHREKELQDGTLKDNSLMDGSKIILIPNVETGLLAQRPENTVMQALESLNDSQVNDFLSGKTPLNLSMRLGDHMMLIQLQLSTVNPANASSLNGSSCSSRTRSGQRATRTAITTTAGTATAAGHSHSHHHHHHHHHHHAQSTIAAAASAARKVDAPALNDGSTQSQRPSVITPNTSSSSSAVASSLTRTSSSAIRSSDLSSLLSKRDYESLQSIVKNIAMAQQPNRLVSTAMTASTGSTAASGQQLQTLSSSSARVTAGQTIIRSLPVTTPTVSLPASTTGFHTATNTETTILEQSPIKSLSNLVSSPIKTTAIKNIPIKNGSSPSTIALPASSTAPITTCQDPIAAKLTSCLCTRLNSTSVLPTGSTAPSSAAPAANRSCVDTSCQSRSQQNTVDTNTRPATMLTSTPNYKSHINASSTSSTPALMHKTANNPITRSKHRHHHHHHHHHHHYHDHNGNTCTSAALRSKLPNALRSVSAPSNVSGTSNDSGFASDNSITTQTTSSLLSTTPIATVSSATTDSSTQIDLDDSGITVSDTRTLAEASRNLTQTLRKLSKEVFTNKLDLSSSEETPRKSGSGAVIESMKNHGKGIYSGTFSGTLNPALQDRYGRPKRDISTVIHILNDLLSATPQYSRGARISFETPTTSAAAAAAATGGATTRSKQLSSKHHHQHNCVKCIKSQPHVHHSHNNSNSSTIVSGTNSASTSSCVYGECNGHYPTKPPPKPAYICCQELSTNPTDAINERHTCSCRYRIAEITGEREREHTCQKCLTDMENLKTKSKLDQLRLVMQQRKQKREARKLKGAPYGARVLGATTTGVSDATTAAAAMTATGSTTTTSTVPSQLSPSTAALTTAPPSEVSPNHIVEEVDTAA